MRLLKRNNRKEKTVCFDLNDQAFKNLMDALPIHVGFISTDRKVVFTNAPEQARADEDVLRVLNVTIGQPIGCKNLKNDLACGDMPQCRNCEINEIINSCFLSGQEQEREITLRPQNSLLPQTYRVKASPFELEKGAYLMLSFENITPEKRKRMMERIFHHDVLNKVNNLQHFVFLAQQKMDKASEVSRMGSAIVTGLEKIINGQRALSKAEHDELKTNPSEFTIESVFEDLRAFFAFPAYGHIFQTKLSASIAGNIITSDKELLTTLLIQMVQNAVEASPISEPIEIGCKENSEENYRFWVYNKQYICEEDKNYIFLPSFSTKGINRGLGTYIIKLFGEGYLDGKVGFYSSAAEGTTFYVDIAKRLKKI
jgi:signal transduction histidine kinase